MRNNLTTSRRAAVCGITSRLKRIWTSTGRRIPSSCGRTGDGCEHSAEPGDVAVLSLQGGLTRAELDLLEVPGSSHLVTALLPDKPVNVGDRWPLADDHLAHMFNLEGVSTQDLQGELKSVEKDEARMELSGKLLGSVDGVITELSIRAKYTFDLQQRRITWVALAIQENRPAGLAAPGLQVTARLRMAVGPAAPPRFLVPEAVSQLNREGSAAGALLEYRSPGEDFVLLLDRHWYVMQQQPQLSVLRWVEDDQFVAQCTLKSLPALGDKKPPTLADFQRNIKRALGESAQQVVDAREAELVDGLRSLKVIVSGRVGDAPIQWIYYHLSHSSGRCLACVFTLSAEEVERFGGEDITLASSLLFLDEPTEPAAPVKAAAADAVQRVRARNNTVCHFSQTVPFPSGASILKGMVKPQFHALRWRPFRPLGAAGCVSNGRPWATWLRPLLAWASLLVVSLADPAAGQVGAPARPTAASAAWRRAS